MFLCNIDIKANSEKDYRYYIGEDYIVIDYVRYDMSENVITYNDAKYELIDNTLYKIVNDEVLDTIVLPIDENSNCFYFQLINQYGNPISNNLIEINGVENIKIISNDEGYICLTPQIYEAYINTSVDIHTNYNNTKLVALNINLSEVQTINLGICIDNIQQRIIPDWTTVSTTNLGPKRTLLFKMPIANGIKSNFKMVTGSSIQTSAGLNFLGGIRTDVETAKGGISQRYYGINGYMYVYSDIEYIQEVQMAPNGQKRTIVYSKNGPIPGLYTIEKSEPYGVYGTKRYTFYKNNPAGTTFELSNLTTYSIGNTFKIGEIPISFNVNLSSSSGIERTYTKIDSSYNYTYTIYDNAIIRS